MTMDDPGYRVVAGVFTTAEIAPIVAALHGHLATRSRAGARHVLVLPEIRALPRSSASRVAALSVGCTALK